MAAVSRPLVFTAHNLAEGANKFQSMYATKDQTKSARARKSKKANPSNEKQSTAALPVQRKKSEEVNIMASSSTQKSAEVPKEKRKREQTVTEESGPKRVKKNKKTVEEEFEQTCEDLNKAGWNFGNGLRWNLNKNEKMPYYLRTEVEADMGRISSHLSNFNQGFYKLNRSIWRLNENFINVNHGKKYEVILDARAANALKRADKAYFKCIRADYMEVWRQRNST